ncbi:MAG: TIGR04086 family membrane protein [Acidimicrobiia bacterium]|nr:TIGR04086 family membrane protein [Acidimicrobiia bacterium]
MAEQQRLLNGWFDPAALVRGLAVAVVPGLAITLATAAADPGDDSPLTALSLVAVLAAFGAGGFVAGRRVPTRALSHGATVGLLGFVTIQVLVLPVSLFSDDGFETDKLPGLVFVAFLLSNVALVGGLLGSRMARSRPE